MASGVLVVVEALRRDGDHAGPLRQRQAERPAVVPAEVADVGGGEVGALRHPGRQAGVGESGDEEVASRLEVRGQHAREVAVLSERVRDRRLQRCARGVGEPGLGGEDGAHQVRRAGGPADLPAGHRVGLAHARQRERAFPHARQGGDRHVLVVVEDQVFVDLVGDHHEVVLEREVGHRPQLGAGEHGAGRVVGAVEQHEPGPGGDRGPQRLDVEAEVRRPQRDRPSYPAGHLEHRDVGVVVGLQHDHLVARLDQPEQGGRHGLGAAGGDHDLAVRVDLDPVVTSLVLGDGPAQHRDPGAGRVLVGAAVERRDGGREHLGRSVLVGEALAEVEGAGADGERGHLGEDRGRDAGEAGGGHPPSLPVLCQP